MQAYCVGGLTLTCATPVAGLRSARPEFAGAPDITLTIEETRRSASDQVAFDRVLFEWPGRYGLTLGASGADWLLTSSQGAASFLVSNDGRRISARFASPEPNPEYMDVLVRRILPRIALFFDRIAIHAAALSKNGAAVLVLGGSGAGKSTLSAALAYRHGWDLLSDDISILRRNGEATVSPAATGVCVWPDSRVALELPEERCRVLPAYGSKVWFDMQQSEARPAQPLRALVSLARSTTAHAPELQRLSPAEGLVFAVRQLIQFNPAEGRMGALDRLIQRLTTTISGIPAYRLTYPADYNALPDVAAELETLLA